MTQPQAPGEASQQGDAVPGRTPPQLTVVKGGFEALARRLLRLMTRETTPELTQMLERLSYRAPLRSVRND